MGATSSARSDVQIRNILPNQPSPPFERCIFIKSSESVNQEGPEDSPSKSWSPKAAAAGRKVVLRRLTEVHGSPAEGERREDDLVDVVIVS